MANKAKRRYWRWAVSLTLFAVGIAAAGTVYRWIDDKGQTHYTDTPPATGKAQEIEIAPEPAGTEASRDELEHLLQRQRMRDEDRFQQEQQQQKEQDAGEAGQAARRERCVHALAQLNFLTEQVRVYKPGPANTRTYLEDRDRPAEIDRLQRIVAESCSKAGKARQKEQHDSFKLTSHLGPRCRSERDELKKLQSPEAKTPRAILEQKRKLVEQYCPEPPAGLWLHDVIVVGPRR